VTSPRQTAAIVIEDIPLLMQLLRTKFREKRVADLSLAQFRILVFVDANPEASLSEAAGHIGLSLPSMSRLVDSLVKHNLLRRHVHDSDRRRICLALTGRGKRELDKAYQHTQSFFTGKFAELSDSERTQLAASMNLLKKLFALNPGVHPAEQVGKQKISSRS